MITCHQWGFVVFTWDQISWKVVKLWIHKMSLKNHTLKINSTSPRGQWVKRKLAGTGLEYRQNFRLLLWLMISHLNKIDTNIIPFKSTLPTRQIWGIWKLRPAYSSETPNLGQNRWCFVPCDLEIRWMNLENNRAPLLCCFKLCATFHSHRWIQTGVAVRKRPIWVKFNDF